jgi:methylase of polypeptide subunit release factors
VLAEGGALVMEVGDGQSATEAAALEGMGYRDVHVSQDLTGRERVVEGRR